jgi:predicted Zn finger-like uncharacterized protein
MKVISCPQCQSSLGITEEMGGKVVRCPQCSHTFSVPDGLVSPLPHGEVLPAEFPPRAAPPREATRQDYLPRRRFPRDDWEDDPIPDIGLGHTLDPRWHSVKSGLGFMFFSIVLVVGAFLFFLCLGLGLEMVGGGNFGRGPGGAEVFSFACLGMLVLLGGGITYLIGLARCVSAPHPRAKSFAMGSLLCLIMAIFLAILLSFPNIQGAVLRGPGMGPFFLLQILSQVLSLASMIFLILFLKTVAQAFAHAALAKSCSLFLTVQISLVLLIVGLGVTMFWAIPLGVGRMGGGFGDIFPFFLLAFWLLIVLGFLISFIWFLNLLQRTRQTIGDNMTGKFR